VALAVLVGEAAHGARVLAVELDRAQELALVLRVDDAVAAAARDGKLHDVVLGPGRRRGCRGAQDKVAVGRGRRQGRVGRRGREGGRAIGGLDLGLAVHLDEEESDDEVERDEDEEMRRASCSGTAERVSGS